jgi:hypothetical protein
MAQLIFKAFQESHPNRTKRTRVFQGQAAQNWILSARNVLKLSLVALRQRASPRAPAEAGHQRILRARLVLPSQKGKLGASFTLMHRSKWSLCSIPSSARASSFAGTSTPSAFAVLRLITNKLELAEGLTGRSLSLAPLRIRPT